MMDTGAKNVLASLWPVSDEVTPTFMTALYHYKADNPDSSEAEALRFAQLTLLNGHAQAAASSTRRGAIEKESSGQKRGHEIALLSDVSAAASFTPDPRAPYAHPFYWAPFVLMGTLQDAGGPAEPSGKMKAAFVAPQAHITPVSRR